METSSSLFSIEDYINKIGSFELDLDDSKVCFEGTLFEHENGKVIISGKTSVEIARLFDYRKSYRITGFIDGQDFSFLNSIIRRAKYRSNIDSCIIELEPSEIVIGRKIIGDGKILVATMELPELSWFFTDRQFKETVVFNEGSPALLDYCFPDDICAEDHIGTLRISRVMNCEWGHSKVCYSSIPILTIEFKKPVSIINAREQIAKARNLFLFFADGYLPLHNICLADDKTSKDYCPDYCDFELVANSVEEYKIKDEPFFVTSDIVKSDFQSIWYRWSKLYSHKFISYLYFEVIRNRATWINRFLNFAQAIELFENIYRADVLKKTTYGDREFKSCILDALTQLQLSLALDDEQIEIIADSVKNARNYFTHYNSKHAEPSYHEVFSMSRVLNLVLIGLVYKKLGLPDHVIENAKLSRDYSSFDRDVAVILKKPIDNVDYNAFF